MIKINYNVETDYPDYLRDESRREGHADSISFPVTQDEVIEAILFCRNNNLKITVQGAKTGITAGAVPDGGHIINLSRLIHISKVTKLSDNEAVVTVEPGAILSSINDSVKNSSGGLFIFPPDPTETSAAIGGMISCNASGACSFLYGPTRNYISRLKVALADGSIIELKRGNRHLDGLHFTLTNSDDEKVAGILPEYKMPNGKNAAGYYIKEDMDLIDLFIGTEGTLGIILEADLKLIPQPKVVWGIQSFFPSLNSAVKFVKQLRTKAPSFENCNIAALEFIDSHALTLLRSQKDNSAFDDIPHLDDSWDTAIYIEFHGDTDDYVEAGVFVMSDLMVECGGDEDATWMASDKGSLEKLKHFRHAVPEAVNLTIDTLRKKEPKLTKLGTDLAVPDEYLEKIIELYIDDLTTANLDYVMFGHIGNNHLHVNIIPNSMDEYLIGKKLYLKWAEYVVELGGTISAEHGVGKLKKDMLKIMYKQTILDEMKRVKLLFDPDNIINDGNLF